MHISPIFCTAQCCTLLYVSNSPCSTQRRSPSLPSPPALQGIFMLTLSSWPPMGAMPAPDEEPGWWAYTMLCGSLAIIALGTGALPAGVLMAHAERAGMGVWVAPLHMGRSRATSTGPGFRRGKAGWWLLVQTLLDTMPLALLPAPLQAASSPTSPALELTSSTWLTLRWGGVRVG